MSALIPTVKAEKEDEKSTNVGRFLARRGVLLIKEFRDISAVKGEYGGKVSVSTLILSSAKRRVEMCSTVSNLSTSMRMET